VMHEDRSFFLIAASILLMCMETLHIRKRNRDELSWINCTAIKKGG
jgi:hypothetical protein